MPGLRQQCPRCPSPACLGAGLPLRRQALGLERQLRLKRAEQIAATGAGPETARGDQIVFDLEKATLEAQRKVADKEAEVADNEKKVVERRLKILEAQRSVMGGR
jgi:hypothetical protein